MSTASSKRGAASPVPILPHSWSVASWPDGVWPNDQRRAKWILRSFRDELIAAGALARGGKGLIVLGRGYTRWLERHAAYVREYTSNNPLIRATDEGGAAA